MDTQVNPSTTEKEDTWLAAYVFYSEPWEELLQACLLPIIENILEMEWATEYFFIRYWEKGPHIRLRFKGKESLLLQKVKPLLIKELSAYLSNHPSVRDISHWPEDTEQNPQWHPNNSVQFISYEPETERYGGEKGLEISEKQFFASSKAVLSIIKENKTWDYNKALGAAIQLNLSFAYAMGMDSKEASGFFHRVFLNWLPRAYYQFDRKATPIEEIRAREKETLKAFDNTFSAQKEVLLPFIKALWDGLNEEEEFEENWLNHWLRDLKRVKAALELKRKKNQLIFPKWTSFQEETSFTHKQQEMWVLYDSYVHMTNNRLGIQNRDEGFLGFLLFQGLEKLYFCSASRH